MRVPAIRWALCWLGVCGAILTSLVLTQPEPDAPRAVPVVADAGPAVDRALTPDTGTTTSSVAPPSEPTCRVVTYTPPFASDPQVGELCTPAAPVGIAMVLVHGGGGTGGEYADADQWARAYHDAGIHTFAIDYRVVAPDVDNGVWPQPEQHTKAAVQYLRLKSEELGIDSIQMQGWSAGARLAGIALTTPDHPDFVGPDRWEGISDAVDAAVLFYGYYSGFVYEPDEYWGGGDIPDTAVPEAMAATASGPALLVHGDIDFLVPAEESVGFAAALRVADQEQTLWIVGGQPDPGFDGYGTDSLSEAGAALVAPTLDWVRAAAS